MPIMSLEKTIMDLEKSFCKHNSVFFRALNNLEQIPSFIVTQVFKIAHINLFTFNYKAQSITTN